MKTRTQIFLTLFITLTGCDSTRKLFRSDDDKRSFWTIDAYTMSHCGCTQLFADKYEDGKKEFEIMYTDNVAWKYIYKYNEKGLPVDTVQLLGTTGSPDVAFDALDVQIFDKIKKIIDEKTGLVYEMKWTNYNGFVRTD